MHQLSMVSSALALRNLNLVKTHFNLTKYKHALICSVPKVNSLTDAENDFQQILILPQITKVRVKFPTLSHSTAPA